jgi:hypothetical protein
LAIVEIDCGTLLGGLTEERLNANGIKDLVDTKNALADKRQVA